jgi:hypothetical protein
MITAQDIQFYDIKTRQLLHKNANKIRKILMNDKIQRKDIGKYVCLPMVNYNKQTLTITVDQVSGLLDCNCQGFKKNGNCTHCEAVRLWIDRNTDKNQGQQTLC